MYSSSLSGNYSQMNYAYVNVSEWLHIIIAGVGWDSGSVPKDLKPGGTQVRLLKNYWHKKEGIHYIGFFKIQFLVLLLIVNASIRR